MSFLALTPLISILRRVLTVVLGSILCLLVFLFLPLQANTLIQHPHSPLQQTLQNPLTQQAQQTQQPSQLTAVPAAWQPGQSSSVAVANEQAQLVLRAAITSFSQANSQRVSILSQSTADPEYNTPQKLLKYPGSAWEFEFFRNKKAQLFIYRDAMDTDFLVLYKRGKTLWSKPVNTQLADLQAPPGKNWSKVKPSLLAQEPYNYTQINSLDLLPFLFLHHQLKITAPVSKSQVNGQEVYTLKMQAQISNNKAQVKNTLPAAEQPQEIIFWLTGGEQPRLLKAQYFWVSHPPGGTMYTVNLVTFQQN